MTLTHKIIKSIHQQDISVEGVSYSAQAILSQPTPVFVKQSLFHAELYQFLREWFAPEQNLTLFTSGSTGAPKAWITSKAKMMNSAELTCQFLGLTRGDKILLCLPLNYIAGKMMVVRALVAGLDIYPVMPSSHPLQDTQQTFQFAAMIPMQVVNSLTNANERQKLQQIENLIIGGGAIDEQLAQQLKGLPQRIYATYGMTETLSHIALRRLNGDGASNDYQPFSSVSLSLSAEGTLIIDAPLVHDNPLVTNDIARINPDGSFVILGRKDNVVNSGGVKIQIEEVEQALKTVISTPFAVSACPDSQFGEILVLLTEQLIDPKLFATVLTEYHRPKKIIIDAIPLTESGKINRLAVKDRVLSHCLKK